MTRTSRFAMMLLAGTLLASSGCLLIASGAGVGAAAGAGSALDSARGPAVAIAFDSARSLRFDYGPRDSAITVSARSLTGRVVRESGDTLTVAVTELRNSLGTSRFPRAGAPVVRLIRGEGLRVHVLSAQPRTTEWTLAGIFAGVAVALATVFVICWLNPCFG